MLSDLVIFSKTWSNLESFDHNTYVFGFNRFWSGLAGCCCFWPSFVSVIFGLFRWNNFGCNHYPEGSTGAITWNTRIGSYRHSINLIYFLCLTHSVFTFSTHFHFPPIKIPEEKYVNRLKKFDTVSVPPGGMSSRTPECQPYITPSSGAIMIHQIPQRSVC